MTAPRLPIQCMQQTYTRNNFLRAADRMILPQTDFIIYGQDAPPAQKFPILMGFSFQGRHPIKIGFGAMPFVEKINSLCAPWKLHELSPELLRAALTHALDTMEQTLPEEMSFQDFALNSDPPKDWAFHIRCDVQNEAKKIQCDIFTSFDFPFSQCAQEIGLRPMPQKTWPPQLYISLPVNIAAANIAAADLPTLTQGDVIFLSQPAPASSENPRSSHAQEAAM